MTNEEFMHEAICEAHEGIRAGHGGPFGCVIVKDGRIVARGHNRVLINRDPTAHGEVMALRVAGEALGTHDLSGCDLYTSSEPCPMCAAAIAWANIRHVYYACTVQDADEQLGFRDSVMYERMRSGEDLTPCECLPVADRYAPFIEYKQMEGTIY